jgi:hypothetical protein
MQQDAAWQQRKSCLSRTATFDPFHCVDKSLDHAGAPLQTASTSHGLRIIGQPITNSDQFGKSTSPDGAFPLLQTHLPFTLWQLAAKVLCKRERLSESLVALEEVLQIGRLLSRAALRWPHHYERNTSGRRRLVQDDHLFGDGASSLRTERTKPHLKGPLRTSVSLSSNFLVQPGHVVAPLVPPRSQVGKVRINDGSGARPSAWWRRSLLFKSPRDTLRTDTDELSNLLFVVSLPIQLPDPFMKTHAVAVTSTALFSPCFRPCRLGSRTCGSCAAVRRLFEYTVLLAKELLQGLGKILL